MNATLITILVSLIFGYSFLRLIKVKNLLWPEIWALSYGLGIGFLTLVIYYLNILGLQFSFLKIALPIIVIASVLLFTPKKDFKFKRKKIFKFFQILRLEFLELTILEKLLTLAALFLFIFHIFRAVHWPVFYWDAIALYDFRSHAWFLDGSIYKTAITYNYPAHPYPPLTSLAHLFSYLLGAGNPKLIYPAFYFSLLVSFFAGIWRFAGKFSAILFTFLLATSYFFVEFASGEYTNLPYAYYLSLGVIYLYLYIKGANQKFLPISGMLLGLSGFVRASGEPFLIAALLVLALHLILTKKPKFQLLWLIIPYVVITASWQLYLRFVLHTNPSPIDVPTLTSQNPIILSEILNPNFLAGVWGVLWATISKTLGEVLVSAIVASLVFFAQVKKHFYLFSLIVLNLIFFIVAAFAFSFVWPTWEALIASSANRLMMFFISILLFYLAILPPAQVFTTLEKKLKTIDFQILKFSKTIILTLLFIFVLERRKSV